jgi:hypothetical protein
VASAIEDASRINDHARGMDLAGDNPFSFDLDATFGEDYTVEAAGDHDTIPLNLSFDLGTFAENNRLLRDDVSFDVAVDAERARDRKRPLESHALVDETCPDLAASALGRRAGPLPRHGNPPGMTPTTLAAPAGKSTKRCIQRVESGDGRGK